MDSKIISLLLEATLDTLYMSVVATSIATLLAILPSILLTLCAPDGLSPNAWIFRTLDSITNTLRSFPFLILMVVLFPLTQFIVGKSIGASAAIVPLSIGAAPFIVRIIENALKEVDRGVIEAATYQKKTRDTLEILEERGELHPLGQRLPVSLVVTDKAAYLSPISSAMLCRRLGEERWE